MERLKLNRGRVRGFTLIEVMTSVAIIAMISGIFLANYHRYKSSGNLAMAAQQVASDLRRAQNYALGLKKFTSSSVPLGMYSSGGWGVNLDTSVTGSYFIFADLNNNQNYNNGGPYGNERYLELIYFPPNITISSAASAITADGTNVNSINIIFIPPDPSVSMCRNPGASCPSSNQVVITLTDGTIQKQVTVNKYGLIDIN